MTAVREGVRLGGLAFVALLCPLSAAGLLGGRKVDGSSRAVASGESRMPPSCRSIFLPSEYDAPAAVREGVDRQRPDEGPEPQKSPFPQFNHSVASKVRQVEQLRGAVNPVFCLYSEFGSEAAAPLDGDEVAE